MRKENISFSYGIKAVLKDEKAEKFETAKQAAQAAKEEGYGFIIGEDERGSRQLLAWEVEVLSREEALERFMCDGDKRRLIELSNKTAIVVLPVKGYSPIVIPFGEYSIDSLKVVKFEKIK